MITLRRGDTLVEVLLATVILSIVLAGASNLSNQAIQTGQGSLERTEAVNVVRDYAETLNFIHSSQTNGADAAWEQLLNNSSPNPPTYDGSTYCDVSVANPKYLDFSQLTADPIVPNDLVNDFTLATSGGRADYSGTTDNNPNDLFAVWLEVYDAPGGVVDIHIRACWDNLGSDNVNRVGSVVRLSETRDI